MSSLISEYAPEAFRDIVLTHYASNPNYYEMNASGKRTHLWRKLSGTGGHITVIMRSPSTAREKNDNTVTSLINRLSEVSDYSCMSLINIEDGYEWRENLKMLINLYNTDVLIAWGSKVRNSISTRKLRIEIKTKCCNTNILEFYKEGSKGEHTVIGLKKNTPLHLWDSNLKR